MHFVNNKDLHAPLHGAKARGLYNFTHIIYAGARGGVHFQHIWVAVVENGNAVSTHTARVWGGAAVTIWANTVKRTGNNTGSCGFAYTAHPGEHKSMRHTP